MKYLQYNPATSKVRKDIAEIRTVVPRSLPSRTARMTGEIIAPKTSRPLRCFSKVNVRGFSAQYFATTMATASLANSDG